MQRLSAGEFSQASAEPTLFEANHRQSSPGIGDFHLVFDFLADSEALFCFVPRVF